MISLLVAWLEAETAGFDAIKRPWTARPPGNWLAKNQTYGEALRKVRDGRYWLNERLPGGMLDSSWPARTRLTVASLLAGAVVGCVLFKPWRRPAVNQPDPAS